MVTHSQNTVRRRSGCTHLVSSGHCRLVGHMVGPTKLLDGFRRHGLGETQAAPRVCWRSHLCHYRLLQHGWKCTEKQVFLWIPYHNFKRTNYFYRCALNKSIKTRMLTKQWQCQVHSINNNILLLGIVNARSAHGTEKELIRILFIVTVLQNVYCKMNQGCNDMLNTARSSALGKSAVLFYWHGGLNIHAALFCYEH